MQLNQFRNTQLETLSDTLGLQFMVTDNASLPTDANVVIMAVNDGVAAGPDLKDLLLQSTNAIITVPAATWLFGSALAILGWMTGKSWFVVPRLTDNGDPH